MTECECGGDGFKSMTTPDLIMLLNIMKPRAGEIARGTRIAIRRELVLRGVRNV